jgi:hypothetical protein
LLEAKKRDKKIYITPLTLDKITAIDIFGGDEELNNLLYKYHRQILYLSMNENDSNEVLGIWNTYTGEYMTVFGTQSSVDISESPKAFALFRNSCQNELAFLHNHPSTNTFSFRDIMTFVFSLQIGLMTVVTNQGEVYVLQKNADYDIKKAANFFYSLSEKIRSIHGQDTKFFENFTKEFLKNCGKAGIRYVTRKNPNPGRLCPSI